jgi:hypothetical protein
MGAPGVNAAPAPFLRFLADNASLVLAIFERDGVDEAELTALIARHRGATQVSGEYVRKQLEELGIIESAAYAENAFELTTPVQELLRWLSHRQRLSSASVLRGYFDELANIERELTGAVGNDDIAASVPALRDASGLIERIRALSSANRDAVVTAAQDIRAAGSEVSATERVQRVRRLWERYLEPLRQLVDVEGELEARLDALQRTLQEGERRFITHRSVHREIGRTLPSLARLRRTVVADHLAALHEVAPLYERIQRDSRWGRGAARALALIRRGHSDTLELDAALGLVGWRTRYLMSDVKLQARLTALTDYSPEGPVFVSETPPPPAVPLISHGELHSALARAAPVDDVLSFILQAWPDHPVRSQLAAYGHVIAGSFGTVTLDDSAHERTYPTHDVILVAWPVSIGQVRA